MEPVGESLTARDILQTLIKARKNVRMYPDNNPMYLKTVDETFARFSRYLGEHEALTLAIKQNTIHHDGEEIYANPEKDDNFALFFFKDGVRELTFRRGLNRDEIEEFLKIIAQEFDREQVDDDVVTLLWERDFENIHYVVDEAFLVDIDEEEYERKAEETLKERLTDPNDLLRAYKDGFQGGEKTDTAVVPLSDGDLQMLVKELEKDAAGKIEKLVVILFELIYLSEKQAEIEEIFQLIREAVHYCARRGDIALIVHILHRAQHVMQEPSLKEGGKDYFTMLRYELGQERVIACLAHVLDVGLEIDTGAFGQFVGFLDKNAIPSLIHVLGELKTVRARKYIIDALIALGKKDIHAIAKGLNDERWYLVRNIIYVLRKIADRRATEHLLRAVRHSDLRVRKEAIKALGDIGSHDVVQTLRECLDDENGEVRIAGARAFGTMGTEVAKKIILEKASNKEFRDREFDEKKAFFEVLSRWKDQAVFEFLLETLRKKALFNRARNEENRACAAYALGLLGRKDAIPVLRSVGDSCGDFLRDFVHVAVRKLEGDQ